MEYTTQDGTATADSDYTAKTGTLTFAVGQRSKTVRVNLLSDSDDEDDETFELVLSNPSGARIEERHRHRDDSRLALSHPVTGRGP